VYYVLLPTAYLCAVSNCNLAHWQEEAGMQNMALFGDFVLFVV
jgi:hypothetical protein